MWVILWLSYQTVIHKRKGQWFGSCAGQHVEVPLSRTPNWVQVV